jgi:hypothetical protein
MRTLSCRAAEVNWSHSSTPGPMTLRDLLGEGPVDVHITGLAYDNRRRSSY